MLDPFVKLDFVCPVTLDEIDALTCETSGITGCKDLDTCKAYSQFKKKKKV